MSFFVFLGLVMLAAIGAGLAVSEFTPLVRSMGASLSVVTLVGALVTAIFRARDTILDELEKRFR